MQQFIGRPEIFAEGFRGALVRAGVVKLVLVSNDIAASPEAPELRQVATLTMPVADFLEVVKALNSLVAEFQEKGAFGPKDETLP